MCCLEPRRTTRWRSTTRLSTRAEGRHAEEVLAVATAAHGERRGRESHRLGKQKSVIYIATLSPKSTRLETGLGEKLPRIRATDSEVDSFLSGLGFDPQERTRQGAGAAEAAQLFDRAAQAGHEARELAAPRGRGKSRWPRNCCVYGGAKEWDQKRKLRGVEFAIAIPGR